MDNEYEQIQVPYIASTAQEEVALIQQQMCAKHYYATNKQKPAEKGEEENLAMLQASTYERESEDRLMANPANSPLFDLDRNFVEGKTMVLNEGEEDSRILTEEEIEERKALLIEQFQTRMSQFAENYTKLCENEENLLKEATDYVKNLKQKHRVFFLKRSME